MRLLLVDDHESVRQGLRALFESVPSIEVVGDAADGFAAIERVRSLDPDMVVLDLTMPRMSGLELASQLGQTRPDMRILLMSGYPNEAVISHGVPPAARLLQKPFNGGALAHAVRQALDSDSPSNGTNPAPRSTA